MTSDGQDGPGLFSRKLRHSLGVAPMNPRFDGHPPPKALRGGSLEKAPVLDPFSDDLARAKSANELKEHLETRVL